jgi:nicotinate-nucleotide pyrophosphorylase (carboxylating)
MQELHQIQLEPIITRALEEDWGYGDWTTDLCVPRDKQSKARIITREDIVVSGVDVAREVFRRVDPQLDVKLLVKNGQKIEAKTVMIEISGNARSILKSERVALNFLGRMSTARYSQNNAWSATDRKSCDRNWWCAQSPCGSL